MKKQIILIISSLLILSNCHSHMLPQYILGCNNQKYKPTFKVLKIKEDYTNHGKLVSILTEDNVIITINCASETEIDIEDVGYVLSKQGDIETAKNDSLRKCNKIIDNISYTNVSYSDTIKYNKILKDMNESFDKAK